MTCAKSKTNRKTMNYSPKYNLLANFMKSINFEIFFVLFLYKTSNRLWHVRQYYVILDASFRSSQTIGYYIQKGDFRYIFVDVGSKTPLFRQVINFNAFSMPDVNSTLQIILWKTINMNHLFNFSRLFFIYKFGPPYSSQTHTIHTTNKRCMSGT